jgi:HlyD family secretion protein
MMNRIQGNYRAIILIALIVAVGAVAVAQIGSGSERTAAGNSDQAASTTDRTDRPTVRTIAVSDTASSSRLQTTGEIKAQTQATLSAQTSGVIDRLPVAVGDRVSAGDIVAEFENASQQAAVRQARAQVQSQEANLAKLTAGGRQAEVRNAESRVEAARSNLAQAKRALLNTDLQTYVASGDDSVRSGSLQAPTISGSFAGNATGEYRIQLYKSGTQSGYSFRYRGLESGAGKVSTDTPQPLGNQGLYITFPENFASSPLLRWVVPIPNTRSNQYTAAKNRVVTARENLTQAKNNLEITRSGARSEDIQAQRAQLASAQASLESAQAQLEKTFVRAPVSGHVLKTSVEPGEYRRVGQAVATVINTGDRRVVVNVTASQAGSIAVGDQATINDQYLARVVSKAPAVGSQGGVDIRLQVSPDTPDLPGSFVDVSLPINADGQTKLPLSAIRTEGDSTYVLTISDDDTVKQVPVTTRSVSGEMVTVVGSVGADRVIADVSGLSVGQRVLTKSAVDNE